MRKFIYEPLENNFECELFTLVKVEGELPIQPEIGSESTYRGIRNIVVNGNEVLIRPKRKKKEGLNPKGPRYL